MKHYKWVTDYFSKKASKYDLVDNQLYWKLSDDLAKFILEKEIISSLNSDVKILDAGAWTWRWTLFFNELFKNKWFNISWDLIDITKEMLDEAKNKINILGLDSNFNIKVWNIENL